MPGSDIQLGRCCGMRQGRVVRDRLPTRREGLGLVARERDRSLHPNTASETDGVMKQLGQDCLAG